MPVDAPMPDVAPDAGAVLKAARIAAGLSVDQVAQRLKLTVRMVEAVEATERRGFPTIVYMRGYARSYAKLLGMDPEPLLAAYTHETPEPSEPVMAGHRRAGVAFQRLPLAMIGSGLLALVLVVLLVWQWPADSGSTERLSDATGSAGADTNLPVDDLPVPAEGVPGGVIDMEELPANAPVTGETVVDLQGGGPAHAGATAPVEEDAHGPEDIIAREPGQDDAAAQDQDPETAVSGDVADGGLAPFDPAADAQPLDRSTADAGSATGPVAGGLPRARRITPVGDDELQFDFTEDCWVEVFNTEGQTLYQDLLRRRESLRLVGSRPFQIRLGYGPGVTLEYNGEPVPLGPHTRNNVAFLVLGQ